MSISNVVVSSEGSNLTPNPSTATATYDRKTSSDYFYDHAMLSLGTITNSGANSVDIAESSIFVTFTATMIHNNETVDAETYWVSAGAEYNSGVDIWIGQASFTASLTSEITTLDPILNITDPGNVEVGKSAVIQMQVKIPHRYVSIDVEVTAAFTYPSPYSICDIVIGDTGSNIGYIAREFSTACTTRDRGDDVNWFAKLSIPQVVNIRPNVETALVDDDIVTIGVIFRVLETTPIDKTYSVHLGMKIDTDTIFTGKVDFTTITSTNPTSAPVSLPTFATPVYLDGAVAMVNKPTVVTVAMTIPAGTDTYLQLTVTSPVSTTTQFNICHLKIISMGSNIACKPDSTETNAVYTSVDANAYYDKATLMLGRVTDLGVSTLALSYVIQIEVAVTALTHASNTLGAVHNLPLIVGYNGNTYTTTQLQLEIGAVYAPVSVQPTLNLAYAFGTTSQSYGGQREIIFDITTVAGQLYTSVSVEFIMPTVNNVTMLGIHEVAVINVGTNTPCLDAGYTNSLITYSKRPGDTLNYRAVIPIDTICNIGRDTTNSAANTIKISAIVRVVNSNLWVKGQAYYPSAGIMYTDVDLWLGQLAIYIEDTSAMIEQGQNTPHIDAVMSGSYCEVLLEYPVEFDVMIKVPALSTLPYGLTIFHADSEITFCEFYLKSLGENVKYINTDFTGNASVTNDNVTVDLGTVTNPYQARFLASNVIDANSIVFGLKLKVAKTATPGSNHTVNITLCMVSQTIQGEITFAVTDNSSAVQVAAESSDVTITNTPVALTDNTADTSTIAPGETRRLLTTIVVNKTDGVWIDVHVSSPIANNGGIELVNLGVIDIGTAYNCLDQTKLDPAIVKPRVSGGIREMGSLSLGYVYLSGNSYIDFTQDQKLITIESIWRLLDTEAGTGNYDVDIAVTINTDINATSTFTWVASTAWSTDKDLSFTFADPPNAVVVTNDTINVKIREPFTVYVDIQLPTLHAITLKSEIKSDTNATAIFVVRKVTAVCAGFNIASLDSAANPIDTVFTSTLSNSQYDKAVTEYGVLTNTGFAERANIHINDTDNNKITVSFELELTDNNLAEHGTQHDIAIGFDFGSTNVIVANQKVTVVRDNLEDSVLLFTANATQNKVYTSGEQVTVSFQLEHDNSSNAEPQTVLFLIYIPPYMKYVNYSATLSPDNVTTSGAVVKVTYPWLLFNDKIDVDINLIVDSATSTPVATSQSVTPVELVYNKHYRTGSTFTDGEYFSNILTTDYQVSNYVPPAVCEDNLGMQSGTILDCQLSDFLSNNALTQGPTKARYGSTGWSPFVRDGPFANHRYLQVFFGNKVIVTKIDLQKPGGELVLAQKIQLGYSNDGVAWIRGPEITVASYSSTITIPKARKSRYLRIYVNEHSGAATDALLLMVELYGCSKTSDVPDVCAAVVNSPTRKPEFHHRGMLEANGKLYFCDANADKDFKMECYVSASSSSGKTWTALDKRVGNIIGHDPTSGYIHGLSPDGQSYLMSKDGLIWSSVAPSQWSTSSALPGTVSSTQIPWSNDVKLTVGAGSPHADYTINNWAAKFDGIYFNNGGWAKVIDWSACCA